MRKQRPLHGPGAGRLVEYPGRNLQPTVRIRTAQATAKNSAVRSLNRRVNADPKTEPRMPWVQQFSKLGSVGVLKLCCTTPGGRIRPSACAVQPSSIAHHPAPILVCRTSTIPSATKPSSSLHAAGFASTARKSISARSSQARRSASNRSTSASGLSASCSTISTTSMMRHADWNHFTPLRAKSVTFVSGINRNPCGRNGPKLGGAPDFKNFAFPLEVDACRGSVTEACDGRNSDCSSHRSRYARAASFAFAV